MIHLFSPYGNPSDSALFVVKAILSSLKSNDTVVRNLVTIYVGIVSGFYFMGLFVRSYTIILLSQLL